MTQNPQRRRTFKRRLRGVLQKTHYNAKGKRLLDVGCAGGAFPSAARDAGFQAQGIEPSRWLCDYARNTYGLEIRQGILQRGIYPDASFDVVSLWDVIEHVAEPSEMLAIIRQLLSRGGYLWVNFPDIGSVTARLLSWRWPFWLSVHLHYYTRQTMRRQLEQAGFEVLYMAPHWQQLELGYVLHRAAGIIAPVRVMKNSEANRTRLAAIHLQYGPNLSSGAPQVRRLVTVGIVATGLLVLTLYSGHARAPYLWPDSYQYLDAATNISTGKCACTFLAHFDEQVAAGRMPVPLTHFPPGYPVLMAAVSRFGVSYERAGYLISAASFLIALWMLCEVAVTLGARLWVIAGFALLWMTHAGALSAASMVLTEAPFTAVLMILAALIARDLAAQASSPIRLLGIAFVAGAGYWLRYPGLFLIPVTGAYLASCACRQRKTPWAVAALVLLATITCSLQVRNIIYSGNWRGGFMAGTNMKVREVATDAPKAAYHLVFGDRVVTRLDIWPMIFTIAALTLIWYIVRGWKKNSLTDAQLWIWLGLLAAVYIVGILAAALSSIASDFVRYFLPVYPLLLACPAPAGIRALGPQGKPLWAFALLALWIAILAIQSRSLAAPLGDPPHVVAKRALQGAQIEQWLRQHTQTNDILVATNGQALHYLLQRPVVSVIHPRFTRRPEDEAGFRALMKRFHARYMICSQEQLLRPRLSRRLFRF